QMSMYERWAAKAPIKTDPTVWQDDKTLKETKLELAGPQYRVWAQHLRRSGAMPIEFILPRLEIVCQNVLPPSMQAAEERYIRDPEKARQLSQMTWGYYFHLGGGLS